MSENNGDIWKKISSAPQIIEHEIEIPEWDVTLYVRSLDGHERNALEMEIAGKVRDDVFLLRQELLQRAVFSEPLPSQVRPFADKCMDELEALNTRAVERLIVPALKLSGIDKQSQEELEKN